MSAAGSLILRGFLLGWAVAWPPGPINAEMMRRGLARGFRAAFVVGLGACSGDALWAIAVTLGAGLLIGPRMRDALALLSIVLLLVLAAVFLIGAWRAWRDRGAAPVESPDPRNSMRGGYFLGLGMALTSPWNMAFWLAVIGGSEGRNGGWTDALVLAASVILGAASWCLLLGAATALLGLRRRGVTWDVVAKTATGLLMLGFAVESARAFAAGA